jgi:RND superfamily putative drug exporter
MMRMGEDFKESDSDNLAMIVLEGQQPLGDDARNYYSGLLRQLRDDPKHVQHIEDLWGDPLTATGVQSADGKAAYVQLNLAGDQATTLANESAEAVRKIVERTPAPNGLKVYVTGPAPLIADMNHSGEKTVIKITVVSIAVIFTMLLLVYRSIITVILVLLMVGTQLQVARGVVAFLGDHQIVGLSTSPLIY